MSDMIVQREELRMEAYTRMNHHPASRVLHVAPHREQLDMIEIWYTAYPQSEMVTASGIYIVDTGTEISNRARFFLGTIFVQEIAWHIFSDYIESEK